jgi:surface antigen/peptidoglycan hydrolase CwlO-like protein
MKLRSATPVSIKGRSKKLGLIIVSVLFAAVVPLQMVQKTFADQYDDQINAIQQQIDADNSQSAQLASQASTYQTAIAQLQTQESTIQDQINLAQAQSAKLAAEIVDTQQKIKDNQSALGQTLASLYVDGQVTPLEMVASSKNISDYLDKEQLRKSVSNQLTATIAQITTLQTQLTQQQTDVTRVLGNEQNSENALAAAQQQQQSLLSQTQGQEAAYQQLVTANQAKQDQIRDEQQAAIAATFKSTGGATLIKGGVAGGYPWGASNCPMDGIYSTGGVDGNGTDGYGYGCRQCASYAAWRVAKETGFYPVNWGNAVDFPASARASGYLTGSTPRPGSLAVMSAAQAGGPDGHVAWVEAVDGDGTIIVSQYNYNYGAGWGMYSEMKLSAAAFATYIYIEG